MVEVFADVRCPFAHVGLLRLVERRESLGLDFTVHVRAWPLELVNDAPLDAALIDEEARALREQVAPDLFAGFAPAAFPATSVPALALTAAAYDRDPAAGEGVALALRRALFEEGHDVGSPAVLTEVAERFDVARPAPEPARARVEDDWREGRERGVVGSPHFFLGGQGWFCPVLDISHEDGRLRIVDDRPAFDAFIERVRAA